MTKPKFIKLAKFGGNYNTCAKEEIERYVVDNTQNDFAIILSENQQKVCNEIRQNNFDFTN